MERTGILGKWCNCSPPTNSRLINLNLIVPELRRRFPSSSYDASLMEDGLHDGRRILKKEEIKRRWTWRENGPSVFCDLNTFLCFH